MKAETKKHFIKYRLLYIALLFFIIFPLGTLLILTAVYNVEAKKFKIKIVGNEVEFNGANFKHFKDSSVMAYFDELDVDYKSHITYYDNDDDKKNKHRPNGFANTFSLIIKLKNIDGLGLNDTSTTYIYGAYHFPGKKGKTVTKETNIVGLDSKAEFHEFGIHRRLPFSSPLVPKLTHERVYFVFQIPLAKQEKLEAEQLKQGKEITGEEKRKLLEFDEVKFYIDFDELKEDKKYKPLETDKTKAKGKED